MVSSVYLWNQYRNGLSPLPLWFQLTAKPSVPHPDLGRSSACSLSPLYCMCQDLSGMWEGKSCWLSLWSVWIHFVYGKLFSGVVQRTKYVPRTFLLTFQLWKCYLFRTFTNLILVADVGGVFIFTLLYVSVSMDVFSVVLVHVSSRKVLSRAVRN